MTGWNQAQSFRSHCIIFSEENKTARQSKFSKPPTNFKITLKKQIYIYILPPVKEVDMTNDIPEPASEDGGRGTHKERIQRRRQHAGFKILLRQLSETEPERDATLGRRIKLELITKILQTSRPSDQPGLSIVSTELLKQLIPPYMKSKMPPHLCSWILQSPNTPPMEPSTNPARLSFFSTSDFWFNISHMI